MVTFNGRRLSTAEAQWAREELDRLWKAQRDVEQKLNAVRARIEAERQEEAKYEALLKTVEARKQRAQARAGK